MTTPSTQDVGENAGVTEVERAIEPVADTAGPDAAVYEAELAGDTPAAAEPAEPEPKRFAIRSNVNRAAIGDKFAKHRRDSTEQLEFNGSHADLTTLAGKLTQEQPDEPAEAAGDPPPAIAAAPEVPATPEARPASGPSDAKDRTFTLTVFDEPMEVSANKLAELSGLTVEDVLAAPDRATRIAQMDIAAQRRLEAAKNRSADQQTSGRPDTAERQNQPDRTAEPPADPAHDPNQDDEARAIAERIQFGTTEEAAEAIRGLRKTQAAISPDDVRKVIYDEKRTADQEIANEHYLAFQKDNAELLKTPAARGALTEQYLHEVREDLRKLGVPEDKIPKDHATLRETHRFHRIAGKPVRDTAALLADSKQALETWKGGSQQPAPRPTVQVNLDRTERRAAIPHQPARAAVPPQALTSPKPVQSARSEAVREMTKGRRKLVIT